MDRYREEVRKFLELTMTSKKEFFVYDTETTGLSAEENDIIEFSALKCGLNEDTNRFIVKDSIDVYIKQDAPLPEKIVEITGITDAELGREGISPIEAAKKVREFLGDSPILVGYNSVSFDTGFVKSLYKKTLNEEFDPEFQLDVLTMAREKTPRPHKLINMAEKAELKGIEFHRAIGDCKATLGVLAYLLPMYKEKEPETDVTTVEILGLRRWTKSHTLDRIYATTSNNMPLYLDVYTRTWTAGENCDIDVVRAKVYAFAGVSSDQELIKKIS